MLITYQFLLYPKKKLMLLDFFFLVYIKVNKYQLFFLLFIPKEKKFEKKK